MKRVLGWSYEHQKLNTHVYIFRLQYSVRDILDVKCNPFLLSSFLIHPWGGQCRTYEEAGACIIRWLLQWSPKEVIKVLSKAVVVKMKKWLLVRVGINRVQGRTLQGVKKLKMKVIFSHFSISEEYFKYRLFFIYFKYKVISLHDNVKAL